MICGEVDGEAEGVVELERLLAGDRRGARREDLLQPPEPALDGLEEARSSVSVTSWMYAALAVSSG